MTKWILIIPNERIEFLTEEARSQFILDNSISEYSLDTIIEDNSLLLMSLKEARISQIDNKTQEIISRGFSFDNNRFSLSLPAQSNLTNIKSNKELFNSLNQFPLTISTLDNTLYQLSYANVDSFWLAGMVVVKEAYSIGGQLKNSIVNATSISEIEQIVDPRN